MHKEKICILGKFPSCNFSYIWYYNTVKNTVKMGSCAQTVEGRKRMWDNPWTYIILFVLVIAGGALLIGWLNSLLIAGVASRYYEKTHKSYVEEIAALLPGKNCGQCGYESCSAYAEAVLHTMAPEDACPYAAQEAAAEMEACRSRLQEQFTDPTPPKPRKPRFWERKF